MALPWRKRPCRPANGRMMVMQTARLEDIIPTTEKNLERARELLAQLQ